METGGAEHFFTLPEELLFEPDLIINELTCLDYFEQIIFRNDGIKTELWPIEEAICENCSQNFTNLHAIEAHLFINPSCFYPLTKQYWYKNPDRKQLCKICDEEMLNESMLKKHCFESENCRKAYIDLYFKPVTCDVKPVLESNGVNTREDLLTSNAGFKHSSKSVGCTTTHISETSKKKPHIPAFTNTGETVQDENIYPYKKVKRNPSMMSEVIDKMQNIPALTQTDNFLQCVDIEHPFTNMKAVSTQKEFQPCRTSTPDVTVRDSDSALKKQPLPLKCHEDIVDVSQYADIKSELVRNEGKQLAKRNKGKQLAKINKEKQLTKTNKGKDHARSAVGQCQVKSVPVLSCLCCGCNFTSEKDKFNHLLLSSSCQLFLKDSFLDGKFLNSSQICDNYSLNKNMCPFCMFTIDDGDVIYHVLNGEKCRNKLEEAISRYTHIRKSLTPQQESLPTLSCLCCGFNFNSQEGKRNHLFISPPCQVFLKNKFLNGQFLNDTPICENYTLNKNMCPFCMFTIDDGDVIYHVLNAIKCRDKLEEAISKHSPQSVKLPTLQCETTPQETTPQQEPQDLRRFKCNICNRRFKTIRNVKCHRTVMHSDFSQNSQQQEKTKQHCPNSNHLFCFYCQKFLKSQDDISSHQCRPTRLLSCYWYKKAVWTENEYQCTVCFEKFFYRGRDLEKHMYTHDKKTSKLFKFLPSSSNKTEMLHAPNLDMTNDISSDTSCHDDSHDTLFETAIEDSSEEFSDDVFNYGETRPRYISTESNKNTFSKSHELNKPSSFSCENCSSKFSLSETFKAHVMMNSNCLLHYENQARSLPVIVPFCFKCKLDFKNDSKFINHQCVGLVSIVYKCALCSSMFYNRNSLSKHENSLHKRSTGLQNVETIQTLNDNETFVEESSVYKCCPCQSTFPDLSQFVEHIQQIHENKMTQQ